MNFELKIFNKIKKKRRRKLGIQLLQFKVVLSSHKAETIEVVQGKVHQPCRVPAALRDPKVHEEHTGPQRYLRLCCCGFKGAFDVGEYGWSVADNSSLAPFIYPHTFSGRNALRAVPRARGSAAGAPWGWHIRHRDSPHLCIFLVYILHNIYLCVYKHPSG